MSRRVSDRILCYAMYLDPPLARIGMTEAEVRATGKPALIATRPMTRVNRAVEKGESLGFMKVLVDAESKQILGASLLGVGCDEAIHCLLDVMYAKAPYTTISRAVHIHPTVARADSDAAAIVEAAGVRREDVWRMRRDLLEGDTL